MKVGFIGLGAMGRGMAANLQKAGHALVVHDISEQSAAPFVEAGAVWSATPKGVAEACDVVFTSLPTPAIVQAVCDGEDGLAKGFSNGATWFDLSTNSVHTVREIHGKLADMGVSFLDAPVSGGPGGAASGRMAILVGGSREKFDACLPLLESMSDNVQHVGDIGAGTIVKLSHNLASTAIKSVVAEVITMGVRSGMDAKTLWQAMRSGVAGRSRSFDNVAYFLAGDLDPPKFALELLYKDISLAMDMARDADIEMPICQSVEKDIATALDRGWARRDAQAVLLLNQERAGIPPIALTKDEIAAALAND